MKDQIEVIDEFRKQFTSFNTDNIQKSSTKFTINNVTDQEIKKRAGYSLLAHLLSFILIDCDESFTKTKETSSILTWFDECLFFHESYWSKSLDYWLDVARTCATSIQTRRSIFQNKLTLLIQCRTNAWPVFVTLEERLLLRHIKTQKIYVKIRE